MRLLTIIATLGGAAAMALGMVAEGCASTPNSGVPDASVSGGSGTGSGSSAGSATGSGTGIPLGSSTGTGSTGTGTGVGASQDASADATVGTGSGSAGSGPGADGGSESGSDGGTGTGSGSAPATGTGSGSGSGCHKPPVPLHPEMTAGVYCPFSFVDGGKNLTCAATQHCCEPPSGTSSCVASGTACAAGDTDWNCEGAPDCAASAGGTVCCGTGTINMQAACGAYPAYPYVSGFLGASCQTACPAGGFQICSQDSECPGGAAGACVPIEPKGNGIGYCH